MLASVTSPIVELIFLEASATFSMFDEISFVVTDCFSTEAEMALPVALTLKMMALIFRTMLFGLASGAMTSESHPSPT